MLSHASPTTAPATPRPHDRTRSLLRATTKTGALATLLTLAFAAIAHAGKYVVDNCPAAPTASINAGPWAIFGSPQADQATCSGGAGAFIGPAGGYMAPNTSAGVNVSAPAGDAIRKATVWWSVASDSGAPSFADASTNAGIVGQNLTPLDDSSTPETFELPSTTTSFTLVDYCSSGDGPTGCIFSEDSPILKLFGAELTVEDSNLPSGSATGGALASTRTLTGTQALAYSVADPGSGVRLVKLLIDGTQAAETDYIAQCPYDNFLACPASISDTISWNTATVPDGEHSLEAAVQDAAQNTSVFYTATITTHNAPVNTTAPAITPASQPTIGTSLTAAPGIWSAPAGAGPIIYTYQWQDCNPEGNACQAIPGAQTTNYTPTPSDAGHTLRVLVNAADNDGITTLASLPTGIIPTPPFVASGPGPGPGSSTATRGAPNGTPTSDTAILHLTMPPKLAQPHRQRAFKLAGRLTNSQSQPIANATLDILTQPENASTPTVVEHATTSSTGAFTITIPAGPSRLIEVGYRAYTNDNAYTATARVHETVTAAVHLKISPSNTMPHTIVLTGHVQGPIPPHGVFVELLVHYRGKWEPFRDPRTNNHGTFHAEYQFQGSIGTFPFVAEILAGQAGFPYTSSYSNTVDVTTR